MKAFRAIISVLLSILFATTLLFCTALGIARYSISQDVIMKEVEKSGVYEKLEESFVKCSEEYMSSENSNKEVIEKFTTKENINNIVKEFSNEIYTNENFDLSKESIAEILNSNISRIEIEKNIEISEEEQVKINEVITNISNDYENQKNAMSDSKDVEIYNALPAVIQMINSAFIGFCVALAVIFMLNISINMSDIITGIKYLASGIIVSGGFLVAASKSLAKISYEQSLKITGDEFGGFVKLLQNLLNDVIQKINSCGMLFMAIGVIAVIVAIVIQFTKKSSIKNKPQVL